MLQFIKKIEKKIDKVSVENLNVLNPEKDIDKVLASVGLSKKLVEIEVEEEIEIIEDPKTLAFELPVLEIKTEDSLPFFRSIQYKLDQVFAK